MASSSIRELTVLVANARAVLITMTAGGGRRTDIQKILPANLLRNDVIVSSQMKLKDGMDLKDTLIMIPVAADGIMKAMQKDFVRLNATMMVLVLKPSNGIRAHAPKRIMITILSPKLNLIALLWNTKMET